MKYSIALLVVCSGALHAVWNAILKRQPRPNQAMLLVGLAATGSAGALALLSGGEHAPTGAALGWTAAAGLFEGTYFVSLASALSKARLAFVYMLVRGCALLLAWPLSLLFLGEPASAGSAVGAVVVLVGLVVSGFVREADGRVAGAWAAALSAISVAGYSLSYKLALLRGAGPFSTTALAFGIGTACIVAAGRATPGALMSSSRRELAEQTAAGVLAALSFALFLHALQHGGAAALLTLRNVSLFFGHAFAWWLGERTGLRGWLGSVLILLGGLLIALAGR